MRVKRSSPGGRKRRRGIYVLPSFITLANMFVGFFAFIHGLNGKFTTAAYLIIFAGFLDLLDGRIARLTKTQTDFGKQLDSLTDLVSFCVVPSLLVYMYTLEPMGRLGWLLAFFFTACGAIRLARFNLLSTQAVRPTFVGLPTTAAGGFMVLLIILFPPNPAFPYITFLMACAMVSTIPFPAFKHLDVKSMRPTYTLILLALLFIIVAYKPLWSLFTFGLIYLAMGPILWFYGRFKKPVKSSEEADELG